MMNQDLANEAADLELACQMSLVDFDQRMALEMAYGMEPPTAIYPRYGVSDSDWEILRRSNQYRAAVGRYVEELQTNGKTFKMKAQVLAEDLLPIAHGIAKDEKAPTAVRLDSVKWFAKVSGLDESDRKNATPTGPMFTINIDLS